MQPGEFDDYQLAASLVREAGELAANMRRAGTATSSRKTSVSDIVTAADHAAEAMIRNRLRAERPEDGLIGEEGTNEPAARTWFADPVDGTYNFASGLPTWCSAVALTNGEGAVLGAIYQPETDELWLGGRDRPATRNGVVLDAIADAPLDQISVATYLHPETLPDDAIREPLLRAIRPAATVRMLGSGSVELAAVAAGRLGLFVQHSCLPWDWYPGSTIARAAGAAVRVEEIAGVRWHAVGPRTAVDEVIELLRG